MGRISKRALAWFRRGVLLFAAFGAMSLVERFDVIEAPSSWRIDGIERGSLVLVDRRHARGRELAPGDIVLYSPGRGGRPTAARISARQEGEAGEGFLYSLRISEETFVQVSPEQMRGRVLMVLLRPSESGVPGGFR